MATICAFGDSNTRRDSSPMGGFRGYLRSGCAATNLAVEFVGSQVDANGAHEGYNGWGTRQALTRLPSLLETFRPDILISLFGTNDWAQPSEIAYREFVIDRQAQIVQTTLNQYPGTHVILGTAPRMTADYLSEPNSHIPTYNESLRQLVSGLREGGWTNVHLVDIYSVISAAEIGDGVHYNDRGDQNVSVLLYNKIKEIIPLIGTLIANVTIEVGSFRYEARSVHFQRVE